jgi:ubiquinone biosynthesis protein
VVHKYSSEQRNKVVDLGVGAIIQMIFRDGFFHADLHPGNLVIFEDASVGFIDLGMVGRFDSNMQKRMFYYMYSLVSGDAASAARYLTSITIAGRRSDPDGFRRAVEDLNRRWLRSPTFTQFSLGLLILQSVGLAGRFRIQYPGEIILMVKALITVEGVGNLLVPDIDVVGVSGRHVRKILVHQFNVIDLVKDSLLVFPELMDTLRRSPLVFNEALRVIENRLKVQQAGPLDEMRGTLLAVACILGGSVVAAADGPLLLWAGLLLAGFSTAGFDVLRRG